jgi:probable addiction module antidote protein
MPRKTKPKLFSAADPEIRPFDAADDLTTPELIEGYLNEAIATGDPHLVQKALGIAARVQGMSKIAKTSGLSREPRAVARLRRQFRHNSARRRRPWPRADIQAESSKK